MKKHCHTHLTARMGISTKSLFMQCDECQKNAVQQYSHRLTGKNVSSLVRTIFATCCCIGDELYVCYSRLDNGSSNLLSSAVLQKLLNWVRRQTLKAQPLREPFKDSYTQKILNWVSSEKITFNTINSTIFYTVRILFWFNVSDLR